LKTDRRPTSNLTYQSTIETANLPLYKCALCAVLVEQYRPIPPKSRLVSSEIRTGMNYTNSSFFSLFLFIILL